MREFVDAVPTDGPPAQTHEVIVVWIDPKYPDAHREPMFRRYLERQGKPALIRFNERDGLVLAPPSVTGAGWEQRETQCTGEPSRRGRTTSSTAQRLHHRRV